MTTLDQRLRSLLAKDPERPAIHLQRAGSEDLHITYQQLVQAASEYAHAYAAEGIQSGEVVVLILQHSEDLIHAFWGAILHGSIPSIMPFLTEKLSPERYRADLMALVSVTRPSAIVTYREFEGEVRSALESGSSVRNVLYTDQIQHRADPEADTPEDSSRSEQEIVLLQHSSGTTGLQKGVALSHAAVLNQIDTYGQALGLNDQDVIVSWLPLYHDMGLIAGFIMPILSGVPLVLSSPFDWVRAPYKLLHSVTLYKGTISWLPNFAFNFLAQKTRPRNLEGVDVSSWRAVINCSEPVRWESHQAFVERFAPCGLQPHALQTSYAMAENVFAVTQSELGRDPVVEEIDRATFQEQHLAVDPIPGKPSLKMMTSGRPIPNTRVRVLDKKGRDLPDRVIGEIALQSDCMLTGYYNRPDATAKAFLDGWYLTGDYGYLSNGELFVSGRKKDMIIVGGKNIYPQDLESLSYEVPGVHAGRSVAFGLYDEDSGTEEVVIIAEVDSEEVEVHNRVADAIRQHVTKNSAIALRHVKVVGPKWILKTSSGKTARSANKEKFVKELGEESGAVDLA